MISKLWGESTSILCCLNFEIHRIAVKRNGYSSMHIHKYKYNAIYVESGLLYVFVPNLYTRKYELSAGQSVIIPPECRHRFIAMDETIAFEYYWVGIDRSVLEYPIDDIVREDVGGVFSDAEILQYSCS